ncbi:hypothetical protein [Ferrimonas sp. YFM]|uniref:hypothetical protein n=1 Tax=Ferrimonas sp. YFM TaxID=3028878 RepID=UPI00257251E6|nr:hypothetical protein [Ferrimonas sp. YFM]BDY04147.1 hypothetical protein F0521_11880 [Ferrimonas sp. YFM]
MQISQHQGSNITLATSQGREAVPATDAGTTAPKGNVSTPKENRITVSISQEARQKLAGEQATTGESKKSEKKESPAIERIKQSIKLIKERLEKAKEQLEELKSKEMDPEAKQKLLDAKRSEIMSITAELSQANTKLAEARKKEAEGKA